MKTKEEIHYDKPYICLVNGEFLGFYDRYNELSLDGTKVIVKEEEILLEEESKSISLKMLPEFIKNISAKNVFFIQNDDGKILQVDL